MEQHIPQEEVRRIIISDMVKKRNIFVKPNADMLACMLTREKRRMKSNSIVPVIGEDTIASFSFGVLSFLLWLSDWTLKWIRSAFEEGSKNMWRYAPLSNKGSSHHEVYLLAPRTYVQEAMNIGYKMNTCNAIGCRLKYKTQISLIAY